MLARWVKKVLHGGTEMKLFGGRFFAGRHLHEGKVSSAATTCPATFSRAVEAMAAYMPARRAVCFGFGIAQAPEAAVPLRRLQIRAEREIHKLGRPLDALFIDSESILVALAPVAADERGAIQRGFMAAWEDLAPAPGDTCTAANSWHITPLGWVVLSALETPRYLRVEALKKRVRAAS